MKSVYIHTLGCKVNTHDGRALASVFADRGYGLATGPGMATVQVINSCSVTAASEKEARYLLRRFRRENPEALRVVTGCYAQTDSAALTAMDEVDFVVPNEAKERLVDEVTALLDGQRRNPDSPDSPETKSSEGSKLPEGVAAVRENRQGHFKSAAVFFAASDAPTKTRAFLKAQDGCNGFCAYCLIPYARGASQSVPRQDLLAEVDRLLGVGTAEIVLTGIHIGDYGRDLSPETSLAQLAEDILSRPGLMRFRISSLEPLETTDALLAVLDRHADKVCDHFHLPLQSGSDRILRLMRRKYDCAEYLDALARIRKIFPDANLTADVIPGFPGETEEDFEDTLAFIRDSGLNGLHVFPYSKRPNTAALKYPGHLPVETIKERARRLRELSRELEAEYARRFIGRSMDVLWEKPSGEAAKENRQRGKTCNYLSVLGPEGGAPAAGRISKATLKGFLGPGEILGV